MTIRAIAGFLLAGLLALAASCGGAKIFFDPAPPNPNPDTPTPSPTPTKTPSPTPAPVPTDTPGDGLITAPQGPTGTARVVEVIDGDTIKVQIGGNTWNVRYIGVDTPETVDPFRPRGYCGHEASVRNAELVPVGSLVRIEKDITERDRFDRLLRYVWVDKGMVGAILLREGLAVLDTFPPDVRWVDDYVVIQDQAQAELSGVWGEGTCELIETPTPTPEPTAAPTTLAYPIPPCANSDCNCPDFYSHAYAQWFHDNYDPNDRHGLDADNDGIACESNP